MLGQRPSAGHVLLLTMIIADFLQIDEDEVPFALVILLGPLITLLLFYYDFLKAAQCIYINGPIIGVYNCPDWFITSDQFKPVKF